MNIVIIPSWYPVESNPINGIFFKEQAKALQRAGHKVVVLFPEMWTTRMVTQPKGKQGVHISEEDGIKTYRYRAYNIVPGRIPYSSAYFFYYALKKLYKKMLLTEMEKPEILHAHSCLWAGWAASKIAKEESLPLLVTEHSSKIVRNLLKPYEKREIINTCSVAEKILCVGPSLVNEFKDFSSEQKIQLVPNIVDLRKFEIKSKNEKNRFKFFSMAFLSFNKGMDVLIQAFAKTFRGQPVDLVIGGDGLERGNLEKLAIQLDVHNQVEFLGSIDREKVAENMQNCDVFVLASRFETFGVVLIEALACGKPIIATACGGPEIIVNERNGLLVPVEDTDALNAAMESIYQNYDAYSPEVIRDDCYLRFSEEAIVKEITSIYKQIL